LILRNPRLYGFLVCFPHYLLLGILEYIILYATFLAHAVCYDGVMKKSSKPNPNPLSPLGLLTDEVNKSDKARQKRILKREANTVLVEFAIYYDTVPASDTFMAASPSASSWYETTTEFVRADGEKIVMSYYNYGETIALPEFAEIKAAIEKHLAFVKRIEKWVADNCNYIEMAVSSKNMARRLVFTQKNKKFNKRSEFYYFDCRLTAQPFRGTASIESNGKFILTKPIEIRIDNRNFSNEDEAYELAIKTMQDKMGK
jgi:hypothetical protein